MEDKRKPCSAQDKNYDVKLIFQAMGELIDNSADIEQLRQEQQRHKRSTKITTNVAYTKKS